MIFAIDVQYSSTQGYAAGVEFNSWTQSVPDNETVVITDNIHEYIPGQFYKRELPCIMNLLDKLNTKADIIIIDGFVWLTSARKPGLGAHLYEALNCAIPVIGIAKSSFDDTPEQTKIFRGTSKSPLFITTAGYDLEMAKQHIISMAGDFRVPVLLKKVDRLCRAAVNVDHNSTN